MRLARPVFFLTIGALLAATHARAEDVADPVDPIEDQALREEAAARFDEALAGFEKAFDAAIEQAQAGGEARERNLARAEVYLEKLETLSDATTKHGETEKFLAKHDASKLGPVLKGNVDWQRARLLLAGGDRAGAEKIADGLGWVRDWWVIGPFDNERGRAFKTSSEPEKVIDLDSEIQGKERPVRWRKAPVRPLFGLVDLDAMLRPNDQALAYAVAFIRSEKAQDAAIRLGSDEAVKAWWNGSEVLSRDVRRDVGFDQDAVAVHLNEGWNRLLLKVCDQTGPWAFRLRLTQPDGSAIQGVAIAGSDEDARAALKAGSKAQAAAAAADAGAKSWYDRQTAGQAKRARDLFHLGLLHFRREYDSFADRRAENLLRQAAEAEPQNAVYRFHYAEAASPPADIDAEKEENRQRQGREKAVEIDPRYAVAWRALAAYYTTSLPNMEKAEEMLRRALDVNPAYIEARLDLAGVLQRRGLAAQAEIERKRALGDARAASLESAARAKASVLDGRGMGPEAIDAWGEVLRLDARGNDVRRRVAELAAAALKREDALKVLDAITVQNPWDLSAIRRRADLFEGADDFAGAVAELNRALAIAPEDDEALRQLGRVHAKSGDVAAAVAAFRRALEVNPKLQDVERYVEFLDPEAAPFEDDYVVDAAPYLAKAAAFVNSDNDGYMAVLDQTVTKVNPDGTSANYVRQVVKILTEAGVKDFDRYWARGWGQLKWKWARVTQAAGGQTVDAKIQGAQADFPALRPGDVIDVAFRHDDREKGYFGDYFGDWQYFADYVPVIRTEYTLITPAEKPFYFHQKNFDAKPVVAETEKDGRRLRSYTWKNEDVPKVRYEDGMPDQRETFPQVQVTTYKDWNEFAKWWASMIRDQRILTDEMKAKVEELVAGREDRFEKIRAIYEFVAGEITYQAWSFNDHGYKPYTTSAIFEKREGDCKDKALLINTMLAHIGIESYPVLIYADDNRGEEDLTLPMVGQFNHCIAWVPDVDGKGTPMFLDGTAQYHSIHTPPAMDRGATVLLVKPEGGEVVKIPLGTPADTGIDQEYRIALRPDGSAAVEAQMKWRGDMATVCRQIFSVEGQRARIVQMMFARMFGKLTVSKSDFDDLKDLKDPWESFRVTLEVPNFAKKDGDAFTLPTTFLDGQMAEGMKQAASRPEREHDMIVGTPQSMNVKVTYTLPEGWTVDSKPEDAEIRLEAGTFRSKAVQEGAEVRLDRSYEFSAPRVKKDVYPAFREAVNRMAASAGQRFKVKPGAAPAAPAEAPKAPGEQK